jgi:hypothetical protein
LSPSSLVGIGVLVPLFYHSFNLVTRAIEIMAEECGDYHGSSSLTKGEQVGIFIGEDEIDELRENGTKCLISRLGIPKNLNK